MSCSIQVEAKRLTLWRLPDLEKMSSSEHATWHLLSLWKVVAEGVGIGWQNDWNKGLGERWKLPVLPPGKGGQCRGAAGQSSLKENSCTEREGGVSQEKPLGGKIRASRCWKKSLPIRA